MALQINGAQALVRLLLAEQVREVFGIVGGKLGPLLHAISHQEQLRFLGVRHEGAAPMMAAGVHAASGRIAVALGEMGPGGLNLASGLGVAFNNNLPLLAITTNQHRAACYPHSGMFMDLDTVALTRPITKWNAVAHDARRLPELVRRAFREALSGRPGPVHLDIPQDVLSQSCSFEEAEFDVAPASYRFVGRVRPHADDVRRAAALMAQARRPLIVAGGGVVASGAAASVRALAQRWQAPVLPTQMALGVVASDSPHFIGHGGLIAGEPVRLAFERADLVLAVGCRWSSWMWDAHGPLARRPQRLISINIDPSALGHPALHELALQADASAALEDLLAAGDADLERAVDSGWLRDLRQAREAYASRLAALGEEGEPGEAMHPAALARAIGEALPKDGLAVFDGGHTSFWSNDLTPVLDVRTRFHEPGMSHLGFGLPYAIALQAQQPERAVTLITGDGSFGFTLNELDTARRHRLPVLVIVHNNAAWGIIRAGQRNALGFELGTALDGTDYAAIARGFGCHGERVTALAEVGPAIRRALASGLPAVLDCRTRFVPHPAMPAFASMNRYGFEAVAGPGAAAH
ncbi:thiamine pyrophosphate-binding protein [Variovorax sp. NFACC27]|uniref:thiamine pyrophosphate-binding protein n=1 Tax=unclassified Variovorax TaxID=663243 RepID=UPI00089A8C46|nr:acetolactate synthase-1/2/3 large subunit [Variovorax sp. NFACC28]SEG97689.1 acetolactate synthase-1/2/3 large subunit [Variovorax sp. NFACC29]SFD99674.1 acetolactate synthase-1/2/3 large subunit [Variovorax sp. NFACC26]SFH25280.1 acetolactate synthase-1/2/3 large subunit [Variovorax sp. NFACC27]